MRGVTRSEPKKTAMPGGSCLPTGPRSARRRSSTASRSTCAARSRRKPSLVTFSHARAANDALDCSAADPLRFVWLAVSVSQRRQWDRDAQPGPTWAKNLVRRAYLIEDQDRRDQPDAERIFETAYPCAVGDIIAIPPSVLAPRAGTAMWKIVRREAAAEPYVARLIVTPANP